MTQELVSQLQHSYDSVPYNTQPFPQTAPEHLHALAFLFGLNPPDPTSARVLEIGCSTGENLFPFAARHPQAKVVGIDLSEVQIHQGQARLKALGLTNVHLHAANIEDLGKAEAPYDYIICHGVFSWVPASVQQAILRVCSENLSENGIAYISYNTYPGWKAKEVIRDAMLLRGATRSTPEEKLAYAKGMLDFLQKVTPDNSVMHKVLDEHVEGINQGEASYLLHEFLEPCNQPMYFKDFLAQAAEYGLGYLAEADYARMFLSNYPASIAEPLRKEVNQQAAMEQYLDFVSSRAFRQTLLVRHPQQARVRYTLDTERLKALQVAGVFMDNQAQHTAIGDTKATYIDWHGGKVAPRNALEYAFMEALSRVYPATLNLGQLAAAIEASGQLEKGQKAEAAALVLLESYVVGSHVRIRAQDTTMTNYAIHPDAEADPSSYQWQWHPQILRHPNGWAVSLWHDVAPLTPLAQTLADTLATPVGLDRLQAVAEKALAKGAITLLENGKPSGRQGEQASQALRHHLVATLNHLHRQGLITPVGA